MGKINIWTLRPNPGGENMVKIFLEKNIVAIGWPNLPDLSKMDKSEIREKIKTKYSADDSSRKIGLHVGIIDRFVNKMKVEDVVVVPDGSKLHIAQISGAYEYTPQRKEMGIPHGRCVNWLKKNITRKKTAEELQKGLRSRLTLYSLNKNRETILEWIREVTPKKNLGTLSPLPEKLKEAISIEILLEHVSHPPPFSVILELARRQIPESTQKRAREIAEKAKVWSGNGTWRGEWLVIGSEDHPIVNYSAEIMEMVENGTLEKEVEKEREKIYREGKKKIKKAFKKAKKGDDTPLKKALSALKEKEELVEGISTEITEEIKEEVNEEEQKILALTNLVISVDEATEHMSPKEKKEFKEGLLK
ncbi:MAG: restriction endonuclease [bacterium]